MANDNNNRPDIDFETDLWKAADEYQERSKKIILVEVLLIVYFLAIEHEQIKKDLLEELDNEILKESSQNKK